METTAPGQDVAESEVGEASQRLGRSARAAGEKLGPREQPPETLCR